MENKQDDYNNWIERKPISHQEKLCGSKSMGNELHFIEKYGNTTVLEVGCGTGHRTFPEHIKRKRNFAGVEKFERLIQASTYKQYIVQGDICSIGFPEVLDNERLLTLLGEQYDITFFFGGVINGFVNESSRNIGWENIKLISERSRYILVDTLTHFDWYNISEVGRTDNLWPDDIVPPQYFYSKTEIYALVDRSRLEIIEERSEDLGRAITRTHFLLKRKN